MRMFQKTIPFAVFALALAGCVGTPEPAASTDSWLIEVAPDTEPLEALTSDDWQGAPGCEDRLDETVTFAIAGEGLVAAVDSHGDVLCVDPVDEVQDELASEGRASDAAELGDAYLVAMGLGYVPNPDDFAAGDPSPQPSIPYGDPSPQPSMQ